MTRTVGLGLIGCGARVRAVMRPHPSVRVVALCDPDAGSIQAAVDLYGSNPHVYPTHQELVADPAVDWVGIGSWNSAHASHALSALRAGKHVFCEKPLATSLDDCVAIRDACQASGRMFSFGLVLRYSPFYRKVADLLRAGEIGQVVSFEFNETLEFNHGGAFMSGWRRHRRNSGSFLLEKCCHDMDLANWLVSSLPVRVASFGGTDFFVPRNRSQIDRIGRDRDGKRAYLSWIGDSAGDPFSGDKDIVDNQVVILEYASGARATFHTNANAGILERRFYLLGTQGAIRADVMTGRIELGRIGFDQPVQVFDPHASGGHGGGDDALWPGIVDSMLHGTPPCVSVDDGLKSAITCLAIDEARDQGTVVDLRPWWNKAGIKIA